MASCLKCGKAKLKRDYKGRRKCSRCGFMPSAKHLDQGGNPPKASAKTMDEILSFGYNYIPLACLFWVDSQAPSLNDYQSGCSFEQP